MARNLISSSASAKLGYSFASKLGCVVFHPRISNLLWGVLGLGLINTVYRATVWLLVYLCWRDINEIQERLNRSRLKETDLYRLSGWRWDAVSWCASFLPKP